jgi:hypothetical protein
VDIGNWVPLRWPCGPLEIERGKRRQGFTARESNVLREWSDPRALELLAGTAVSCLVVTWADGSSGDEGHQRALAPLIAGAHRRGLSVIGWVAGVADLRRAASAAQASGLAAVATESREPLAGFDVLRFRRRGLVDLSPSGFLGDLDAVWPGMRPLKLERGVDAVSGATARPWIDSNAWYVRLARSLLEPKALWLSFDPPDTGQPVPADSYLQAIADTEVGGARWVVSLDPTLRVGLSERRQPARDTWAAVSRGLAFFRKHSAWAGYLPVGQIGVVSDYAGTNEALAFEVLNLLARQNSLYRVLEKGRVQEGSLEGLDAVLYVDETPPARGLVAGLYAFAEKGGTLITPPGWETRGVPDEGVVNPRFRVSCYGRGRLAVAREDLSAPDLLAEDAQLLTSYRRDRVRVFNLGVGQLHYATSGDGRAGVLHALHFPTPYPLMTLTVWFQRPWAMARGWTVGAVDATPAARTLVEAGVEFHLPPVPVYCALEVSG